MRQDSMSNQEYDKLIKDSKGFSVQGSIVEYKDENGRNKRALRVPNGMLSGFADLKLWIGGHKCSSLPVGTRITIDIPPGVTTPYNYFVEHPMEFQVESDDDVEWIND